MQYQRTRNTIWNKVLSAMCALVLAVSLVPSPAFAQNTDAAGQVPVQVASTQEDAIDANTQVDTDDVADVDATVDVDVHADVDAQADADASASADAAELKTNESASTPVAQTLTEPAEVSEEPVEPVALAAAPIEPPISSATLQPGIYTVSANVYINGSDNTVMPGMQPYFTNPDNPKGAGGHSGTPTTPMTHNATLVVSEDGAITLDIDIVNPVFTLQSVISGSNISVINADYVSGKFGSKKTRISHLTLGLADFSGSYTFSSAEQVVALPIARNPLNAPTHVAVDFAQAVKNENALVKPAPATLTYTGVEQTAVRASDAYTITGTASATNVGAYEATVTLAEGKTWADGTTDSVTIAWEIAPAPLTATYAGESIAQGANPALAVKVEGFVNGELPVNAAGYKAPVVALPEGMSPETLEIGEYELTPAGGDAANYVFTYVAGKLIVKDPTDAALQPGTYKVSANLYIPGEENPIMTGLQPYFTNPNNPIGIGGHNGIPTDPMKLNADMVVDPQGGITISIPVMNPVFTLASITDGEGVSVQHVEKTGVVDKTNTPIDRTRISNVVLTVDNTQGTYVMGKESSQYVTLFEMDMKATTKLDIDFLGAQKVSEDSNPESLLPEVTPEDNGTTPDLKPTPQPNPVPQPEPEFTPDSESDDVTQNEAGGTLAAGTYTVSANIWLSKEDTGLPLNPHFTNGSFPPMDPVMNNATLYVDANGHAQVVVPIVIQKKIMDVKSITGLGIVDYTMNGDGYSSITIDLGVLDSATTVVTRYCTANVHIGDLAMTIGGPIFGGVRDHTYPATFQMNIKGVPMSGGGTIPENVRNIMNGGNPEANKLEDAEDAASKALADMDEPIKSTKSTSNDGAKSTTLAAENGGSDEGGFPWPVAAGVTVVALAALGAFLLFRKKQ